MSTLDSNKQKKYKVIPLLSDYSQDRTILLQKAADKGWRLITVDNDYAYLEKDD